ncbi:MAG TPA: leucyl aminopeptidase [Bacteroidales bacterium]|nr:leucyl aminopeptidase [Bacteroidales bacterium]
MQFSLSSGGGTEHTLLLAKNARDLDPGLLSKEEIKFIANRKKEFKEEFFAFNRLTRWVMVRLIKEEKDPLKRQEECRKAGDLAAKFLNDHNLSSVLVDGHGTEPREVSAFAEGLALGNYQFGKYKNDTEKKNRLNRILIRKGTLPEKDLRNLQIITEAVGRCRDLVNEPYSFLNALVFAEEIRKMGKEAGVSVEILNRKQLESLKMGGLLGVNQGSSEPPTFTVMEWKPARAKNRKPYVFIGKGIVFDSGGMNLKPGDSMLTMKCDMSGAAAVATALTAIAKANLPVHVVGLIPATDNRPGPHALVPGDILRMHNKMTVEVLNTDAEGRLILADALSYARRYDPALVIDLATLTGSAARAIGRFGIVAMEAKAEKELAELKKSGWEVYERLVEFPNWDEYGELMKSDVADLKNLGPAEGGAITAGKFLEKFTDYPYIHLDIAGPAFLEKRDSYRGIGGTGVGVRLLFDFVKRIENRG